MSWRRGIENKMVQRMDLGLRLQCRFQESPKSLKRVFPGLPARSVKKGSKKSPNTDFHTFLTLLHLSGFGDFSDTFLTLRARRPGRPFGDFPWGFPVQRAGVKIGLKNRKSGQKGWFGNREVRV